ncbi:MAG: hypothetical protein ACOX89_11990 [Lutispora sp.]|jgi:hypothetical protein
MYLKKLITVILCTALLLCSSGIAYADAGHNDHPHQGKIIITPQMFYINKANSNLSITATGQAQVKCYIEGYSGTVTKVSIEAELQQYKNGDWVVINSWYQSSSSYKLTLSKLMTVPKGYSYRVVADVTAYSGSDSETKTVISSKVYY